MKDLIRLIQLTIALQDGPEADARYGPSLYGRGGPQRANAIPESTGHGFDDVGGGRQAELGIPPVGAEGLEVAEDAMDNEPHAPGASRSCDRGPELALQAAEHPR